jgi:hypothetical protein
VIKRVATTTIVTAAVLLAATAAGFALSYAPGQTPRPEDLPRVVTTKSDTPVSAADTATTVPTTAPHASVIPVRPPVATRPRSSSIGSSKPSAPKTIETEQTKRPSDSHEVVTPPVHDSDGEEIPKGDSKPQ